MNTNSNTSGKFRIMLNEWLPSKGTVLFTILALSLVLWAQGVGAISLPAPVQQTVSTNLIPYQGRLTSADDQLLTQPTNMVFRIYNVASGGTPLWEEQWTGANNVQVNDGLFNVMLGSLTSLPAGLTNNSNLFLGITIGTDGEMSPRVQLGSVPFAMQAVNIPDNSVTSAKIQNGSIGNDKLSVQTYPNIAVLQEKVVARVLSTNGDTEKSAATNLYVDLLSQSVTITEPAVLRIGYRALTWKTLGNGRIALGLRLNGTANTVPPVSGDVWNSWIQVGASASSGWVADSKYLSNVSFIKVDPGTHTLALVVGSWDGGNVSARSYAMDIEVMKQ